MGTIRYPAPQNDMNMPMDTNKDRHEKPVQTPGWGAEVAKPDSIMFAQMGMTTAAEVGWNLSDMTEPSRCQGTAVAVAAEEAVTDDQESVGMTEILRPRNYLEIPVPRMPGVFLELAEEARNSTLVDNRSDITQDVQPQRTGLIRPVFVTGTIDSAPVLRSRALRVTNTSAEMIPKINLGGRGEPVNRSGPVGPQNNTEQPELLSVNTDKGENGPNGLVGRDVMLAGRREMVDRPDLVGPHSETEQSVFPRLDVDQVEHVPANIVHPGVKMFRNQPVADGPAGPDRRRRPVGTDGRQAVHDADRPTAGGPVGRFSSPSPLRPSRMSSLDESYQPLAMGPLGTNGIYAVNDSDQPTSGGPVGRLFSLDPMGPRGMSSLGDGNQPPCVGPVGKPLITGRLGDQVSEPDCKRTTQTRSESESDTGVPDPVIQTGSKVQPVRVNISTANGPTDSRKTPPSSDSGVHSLGEQWENMSTNSRDTVSVQNEEQSYGDNTSQVVNMYSKPQNTEEGVMESAGPGRFVCLIR